MTRDFNNQHRENTRSFSHNNSSPNNRNSGEGHGPNARAGRPRLNREIVDRAWESGARQQHADYRTRTSGPATRGNGNSNFQGRPYGNRDQNGYSDNRRPYGSDRPGFNRDRDSQGGPGYNPNRRDSRPPFNRDNNHHDGRPGFQRGPGNYQESRPGFNRDSDQRSFQRGPGNYQESRPGFNRDRAPYNRDNDQRGGAGFQRGPGGYQENRPGFNRDNNHRGPGHHQEGRPSINRDERAPYNRDNNQRGGGFNRDSRPGFNRDNDQRGPRSFQRDSRPGFNRDQRGSGGFDRSNGGRSFNGPRPFNREGSQFAGDYEHFNAYDERGRSTARPFQGRTSPVQPPKPERHVTRMEDGRVIKGSRASQRKNAQFWEEIGKDAKGLVAPIKATPETEAPEEAIVLPTEEVEGQEGEVAAKPRKPVARRPRTTAAASRTKRTEAKKRSTGPRPSQKGFKWPTQEAGTTQSEG